MELFRAEKVGELETNSTKECYACGEKLDLVRTVLIATTGSLIHMFECRCGERVWDE